MASTTGFRQMNIKRTKYRKTLDEEEQELARLERQKRGREPDWDVILSNTGSSPLVVVDAYNIMHRWPRLKKWMAKGMLHKAREYLVHDLEELRSLKGWRIECVFDGAGRPTTGPLGDGPGGSKQSDKVSREDMSASKKVTSHGVRVVYSGVGASADSYIENRCFEAKNVTEGKLTRSLIVASDDAMIRTAASSAGALCMGADRFVDELKAARKATMYRVEVEMAKANGHAVRPEKLRGTTYLHTFGMNSILIEDKRKQPKKVKKPEGKKTPELKDIIEGTKTVPSWAIIPNHTKPYP